MLTLLTGAPGTGKTAALVDMLSDIAKHRALYVYGLEGLKLPHFPLDDPTKWMELVPDGSLIVIDEVQQVWRPRGPGTKVPDHIAALETHRHRGLDIYMTTQGPNLLDANVRALVGRHIHLREMGILGRHWYEWPECADNCRVGYRNAPIKKRYKLPKRVFDSYKSASVHIKPVRSFPMALVVAIFAIAIALYLAFGFYQKLNRNISSTPGTAQRQISSSSSPPSSVHATVPRNAMTDAVRSSLPVSPSFSKPLDLPLPIDTRPPVVFAGCAVAKGVCRCYDTSGQLHDPKPGACDRAAAVGAVTLSILEPSELPPRPSSDIEADQVMLAAVTKRTPLPWITY